MHHNHSRDRYTFGKFLIDAILTLITQGLWLIWVIIREVRKPRPCDCFRPRERFDRHYQEPRDYRY